MLSRRSVRIKVMQVLYAVNRKQQMDAKAANQFYRQLVDHSYQLYILNLLLLLRTAEYSRQDLARRQTKLRPTEEDRQFSTQLADNELTQSLSKNVDLQRLYSRYNFKTKIDADRIRSFYSSFAKTSAYQEYWKNSNLTREDHINILLQLYRHLINEESYVDLLQDHYPLWPDDKSLVVGAMKKTIKALPAQESFQDNFRPGDETIQEFGATLLERVIDNDDQLLGIIEPVLKNWDAERVAPIDMILLKMAISELIGFPTIPPKVTLNEFVDIAKVYSTDKSKDFINGILDRLMKKLADDGLIRKEGRGLVD